MDYFSEQTFTKINASQIANGDYDSCTFIDCDFSGQDLSDNKFSDCEFRDCDLSNLTIRQAVFRDVIFKTCKMIGIAFEDANQFNISFRFDHCVLNHASFYQLDIRKTVFKDCELREADFTESNLASSVLDHSDLNGAVFDRSILDQADFQTARDFSINPNQNQLKKTKFSKDNLSGLLDQLNIVIG